MDDTQLYLSLKPDETNKLTAFKPCLKDIKTWINYNFHLIYGTFIYHVLNDQALPSLTQPIRYLCSQDARLSVISRVSKSRMGAKTLSYRASLSCGTILQSSSRGQTPFLHFRVDLKPSSLIKLILRAASYWTLVILL